MLDVVRSNNYANSMFHTNTAFLMGRFHFQKTPACEKKPYYSYTKKNVVANSIINADSSTDIIDVTSLEEKSSPHISFLEVADSNGRIYCVDRNINTSCWLKIVRLADDCQSSNVELMANSSGIYLKSKKIIVPGEPLLMWFEANVLAMIDMPYLTHSNIQGQNNYVCHRCNDHFEYPNPLKIHLMTSCNKLGDHHLWSQLAKQFKVNLAPQPQPGLNAFKLVSEFLPVFRFEPPRTPPVNLSGRYSPSDSGVSTALNSSVVSLSSSSSSSGSPTSPSRLSSSASSRSSNQASPPSPRKNLWLTSSPPKRLAEKSSLAQGTRHSAFKPYFTSKPAKICSAAPFSPPQPAPLALSPPMPPALMPPSPPADSQVQDLTLIPLVQEVVPAVITPNTFSIMPVPPSAPAMPDPKAAEMETMVSNMGKIKEGHYCIYCGKVYSRKYGLKIHIRTHTGYKPLKCKFCLRPFGDPSNLNKHVRLHADGDTPYKCDLCGKVLVRRRDLERHIKSRHSEHMEHMDHIDHQYSDVSSELSDC